MLALQPKNIYLSILAPTATLGKQSVVADGRGMQCNFWKSSIYKIFVAFDLVFTSKDHLVINSLQLLH